ncbi:hypothetical protein ACIKT0_01545 [Hansschlegelia beijingensis]|uniref:hypothetical protein n=1 Tax=Hansschlegelia beijingensis TaxID=1133344 RepID=UPI00387F0246
MRRLIALSLLSGMAAGPAFAADVPESYYERHSYERAPVERETVVEEPAWRSVTIEEEEPVEERVIVRRPPPVVVRRTYVEEFPRHHGWRHARRDRPFVKEEITRYDGPRW